MNEQPQPVACVAGSEIVSQERFGTVAGKRLRIAVVYYSHEGNSRHLAREIARVTDADLIEITPRIGGTSGAVSRYVWGGKQIEAEEYPELVPIEKDLSVYDLYFFGSPVWNRSLAPPLASFLSSYEFFRKKFALFCTYAGRIGNYFEHAQQKLLGGDVLGTIGFKDPLDDEGEDAAARVRRWALAMVGKARG